MRPVPPKNVTFLFAVLLLSVFSTAHTQLTESDAVSEFHRSLINGATHHQNVVADEGAAGQTVPADRRVNCLPDHANVSVCAIRNCIRDTNAAAGVPSCYFPKNTGYKIKTALNTSAMILEKAPGTGCPFGKDIPEISFSAEMIGKSTFNVRIGAEGRFEPNLGIPRKVYDTGETFDIVTSSDSGIFSFKVQRHSTNATVWDTSVGGLLFADQYIQIAALLGSSRIYGIGENVHIILGHDVEDYTTWALFAQENDPVAVPPIFGLKNPQNLYGVYPFFIAIEEDYKAHGVLLLNSNPQEITIGPAPHIVYRTIGGILDIYFFPGPSPEDVVRQYLAFVGTPMLPAYWALGFQLGRHGYKGLSEMQSVIGELIQENMPLDVVFADIDYMNRSKDFAMAAGWEDFPNYVNLMHGSSRHVILELDPAVQADGDPFRRAVGSNVDFVEWETKEQIQKAVQELYPLANNTKVMLGVLRADKHVAYPDFGSAKTKSWWRDELRLFYETVKYDGLSIVRNEPTSMGTNQDMPGYWLDVNHTNITSLHCPMNSTYEKPPYETANVYYYDKPNASLSSKTLCMVGMTKEGRLYDVKDLYGLKQSIATKAALEEITGKRGAIMTRSSYLSGGSYAGHSTGDNEASWLDLVASVIAIQNFNMLGIPYVGADICGYKGNTTDQLCLRWHQLGAFYTLSRNRNDDVSIPQHPTAWFNVGRASRSAIMFRYTHLPYLYTLMFEAARDGGTVIRPLFFEFPDDDAAYQMNYQFMWGPAMLIAPELEETYTVYVYLPRGATWYTLTNSYGVKMPSGFSFVNAPTYRQTPVFIRGGHIIPRQDNGQTTAEARKTPFELIVAVENSRATGKLIWDDGESVIKSFETHKYIEVNFTFTMTNLTSKLALKLIRSDPSIAIPNINFVSIIGHHALPILRTVRKEPGNMTMMAETMYYSDRQIFFLNALDIFDFARDKEVTITWSNNALTDLAPPDARVDCIPEPKKATRDLCEKRGCIWDSTYYTASTPKCYFPKRSGYVATKTAGNVTTLEKFTNVKNPFGENISPLIFSHSSIDETTLNIRITDSQQTRYEPPLKLPRNSVKTGDSFYVQQSNATEVFSFKVIRKSTNVTIWDTSIGGLMFSDQFIQIAAYLGSSQLYGIGENVQLQLRHNMEFYMTWPMFARDEHVDSQPIRRYFSNPKNLYGVHPFYMAIEDDYKAHGVFILNSNAQEIATGPSPHIIYRTVGGMIDIYFFPGPTPEDVIKQYLALIGYPALPPYWALGFQICKYGYKNLAELKNVITEVQNAGIPIDVVYADIDYMNRYQDFTTGAGWEELPSFAQQLHAQNMHMILIFEPALQVDGEPFSRGLASNAKFVEWERFDQVQESVQKLYPLVNKTKIMLGVVWPDRHVAFADFSDPATVAWWKDEIGRFHKQVGFDGMWLDMNEPSNFGTNEKHPSYFDNPDHPNLEPLFCPLSGNDSHYDMPPYETFAVYLYTNNSLSTKTLCMLAQTKAGRFYDVKNLYGLQESIATQSAFESITSKRTTIITRSSYPSIGHYAGHWLGDNSATWYDLRTSIVGIQDFNMFGVPYVGADICGFTGNTTEELCLRWQQLGAFYTYSRNHNDKGYIPQHPSLWPSVAAAARQANLFRYHYLPYLYTLLYEVSVSGGTVIRPLFFEFPFDDAAHEYTMEFMWGPAMLISPVIYQGWKMTYTYLPYGSTWYSLRDFDYAIQAPNGYSFMKAQFDQLIPLFVRGGYILPRQAPELTTVASRKNPFEILVVLGGYILPRQAPELTTVASRKNPFEILVVLGGYILPRQAPELTTVASRKNPFEILVVLDANWTLPASGSLFWDDGESLLSDKMYFTWEFKATVTSQVTTITITPTHTSTLPGIPTLDVIEIFGYPFAPRFADALLNNSPISISHCGTYDVVKKLVSINCPNLINIAVSSPLTLTWTHTAAPASTSTKPITAPGGTTTTQHITPPAQTTTTTSPQTRPFTTPESESTTYPTTETTTSSGATYTCRRLIAVLVFTCLIALLR
ncbi:Maltase-glucoamylase, intestinal [Toxocara canis]|uniref:Maltase-glucoamylase, intestinal n=1 Tax=Toxocara canis TaxID=6265 RepID=A0A0B2UTW7_TOXCA|nr:Maltase-glucoamylase, intestinal [Toxocara canis]